MIDYTAYINSPEWKAKSKHLIAKVRKCQLCSSKRRLSVHHNTYRNLGNEPNTDLTVLCWYCHSSYHDLIDPFWEFPTRYRKAGRKSSGNPFSWSHYSWKRKLRSAKLTSRIYGLRMRPGEKATRSLQAHALLPPPPTPTAEFSKDSRKILLAVADMVAIV